MATTPTTSSPSQGLLAKLNECPPFVCYYAAQRNRARRPTLPELVKLSGMSQRTFGRIAHRITWQGVTIERASQFAAACGVDPLDPGPVMVWLAERRASGRLFDDFDQCRGQGKIMVVQFNLLASKFVLTKEGAR